MDTNSVMGFSFYNSESGIKKLDEYLLTHSYISEFTASKDDLIVYVALGKPPSSNYLNVSCWYNHIEALLSGVGGHSIAVDGFAVNKNEYGKIQDITKLEEGFRNLSIDIHSSELKSLEERFGSLSVYKNS